MGIVSVGLACWLEGNPSAYHLFKWRKRISPVIANRQILSVMLIALFLSSILKVLLPSAPIFWSSVETTGNQAYLGR